MKAKIKIIIGCLLTALLTTSTYGCKGRTGNNNSTADADTATVVKPVGPKFNADSAMPLLLHSAISAHEP